MLRIAFIGAGQVNFGGGQGPWNHAKRLEDLSDSLHSKTGPVMLTVVGIFDSFSGHAQRVLERQRSITKHPALWKDTQAFDDLHKMLDAITIDAVFIGVPPEAHGSSQAPNDIEVQCAKRKIHMFIEKPISCHLLGDVRQVSSVLAEESKQGLVVSVGYMFRYSNAIKKMKEVIATYGEPKAFMARYNCAYSTIGKEAWWNVQSSGGPIVEQATHFCDLARCIMGEVDLNTVSGTSIKQTDPIGKLSALPKHIESLEESIPAERRVPRVTYAHWSFKNGAIGSLMHGALLHGVKYESEIEVWGDGYRMVLMDPYTNCRLSLRLPNSEETVIHDFNGEDTYYTEDKVFLEAIIHGSSDKIASSYEDAFHTYELSWKIRTQCE
jgi:predicted dehydrogenase